MSVSLLQLSDRFDTHIYGDVIIHPSAVLAPGIILQAATNSRIVIGAGVCLGMGSILQVSEGYIVQIRGFWSNLMSWVPTIFYEKHSQMCLTAMG